MTSQSPRLPRVSTPKNRCLLGALSQASTSTGPSSTVEIERMPLPQTIC